MLRRALLITTSVFVGAAVISVPFLAWALARSTDDRDEWRHRYESLDNQWHELTDTRNALEARVTELKTLNEKHERADENLALYVEIADWLLEQLRFVYGTEQKLMSQPMDTHPLGVMSRKADRINDMHLRQLVESARFVPQTVILVPEDWFRLMNYVLLALEVELGSTIRGDDADATTRFN